MNHIDINSCIKFIKEHYILRLCEKLHQNVGFATENHVKYCHKMGVVPPTHVKVSIPPSQFLGTYKVHTR